MIQIELNDFSTPTVAASMFDLCCNVSESVNTRDGKPFNKEAYFVMMASMFVRGLASKFGHQTALAMLQVNSELLNEEFNKTNQPSQQGN
jgi:hypothetical protein